MGVESRQGKRKRFRSYFLNQVTFCTRVVMMFITSITDPMWVIDALLGYIHHQQQY